MRISGKNTSKKKKENTSTFSYLIIVVLGGGGERIIIFLKRLLFVNFLRISSIFLLPIYLDFQILGNLGTWKFAIHLE